MHVKVEWHENKYMRRGGYWFLQLMYGDRRDNSYKYGYQTGEAYSTWGAGVKARHMIRKAKRMEKNNPRKSEWIVEQ